MSARKAIIVFTAVFVGAITAVSLLVAVMAHYRWVTFTADIKAGDVVSAVSFTVAAIGLFLNWWQLRVGGVRNVQSLWYLCSISS